MNPVTKLNQIKNIVLTFKAHRAKNVVQSYLSMYSAAFGKALPIVIKGYDSVAQELIDKTAADPQPLINLIDAVDSVAKHYGPGLKVVFAKIGNDIDVVNIDPILLARMQQFQQTLKEINDA